MEYEIDCQRSGITLKTMPQTVTSYFRQNLTCPVDVAYNSPSRTAKVGISYVLTLENKVGRQKPKVKIEYFSLFWIVRIIFTGAPITSML